jgi:hypothetical protein
MTKTAITVGTGSSVNGRLLAQTAITLNANSVTAPTAATSAILVSAPAVTGPYSDAPGQSLNLVTQTLTVPRAGGTQFYRIRSDTTLAIANITASGANLAITYK